MLKKKNIKKIIFQIKTQNKVYTFIKNIIIIKISKKLKNPKI